MKQIGVATLLHTKVGRLPLWSLITREFDETFKGEKQMMVTNQIVASASTDNNTSWHGIDWSQCHKIVRSHQVRIVKATKEGRWGKAQALQRILTHSFSGKAIAVKRVIENRGKNTPGVDGETWSTPIKKFQAIVNLKQHGYNAAPLRRVYIPKTNGKRRPLGIPTMKDRAMQALYKLALEPIAETTADKHSYGFRPERSTADAIEQCYLTLSCKRHAQWVLEGDIEGCFDNINHQWLLENIPMNKTILRKWLEAGYMESNSMHHTNSGTPQGGIISPILANLALDGLETILAKKFPKKVAKGKLGHLVNYIRYADDFIITGRSKEQLENLVLPIVKEFLCERGLSLSTTKTKITHIESGFDFLGQNVRKYDGKFLIKPSKTNVQQVTRKIRKVIKDNKSCHQIKLIQILNPIIQGWALYHRHIVAKESFGKLKNDIFKALWQWATRRHPKKNRYWIKDKYFKHIGQDFWCFAYQDKINKNEFYKLINPAKISIKRHVKIIAEANPYDKELDVYFENRLKHKMCNSFSSNQKLRIIWNTQKGKCPVCLQNITLETKWDIHHKLPRSKGGDNKNSNLAMLHINCHRQIHDRGFQ
jgi:RNA-directed DNA polymerase